MGTCSVKEIWQHSASLAFTFTKCTTIPLPCLQWGHTVSLLSANKKMPPHHVSVTEPMETCHHNTLEDTDQWQGLSCIHAWCWNACCCLVVVVIQYAKDETIWATFMETYPHSNGLPQWGFFPWWPVCGRWWFWRPVVWLWTGQWPWQRSSLEDQLIQWRKQH